MCKQFKNNIFLKRYVCQHCVAPQTCNHTAFLCVLYTNDLWKLYIWPFVGKVGKHSSRQKSWQTYPPQRGGLGFGSIDGLVATPWQLFCKPLWFGPYLGSSQSVRLGLTRFTAQSKESPTRAPTNESVSAPPRRTGGSFVSAIINDRSSFGITLA